MKICVIHPKATSYSAKMLAEAIGADLNNPYVSERFNFSDYDLVFNYGISSGYIRAKNIINLPSAVAVCVDKVHAFNALKVAGVHIPAYAERAIDVPKTWDIVVTRTSRVGRKGDGLDYVYQYERQEVPPNLPLYTEYFEHDYEFRVIVFNGKIVERYMKVARDDEWCFDPITKQHFEDIDDHCIRAAKALKIDYVGFDVVCKGMEEFVILEANSGATMQMEALRVIKKYFKALN